MFDLALGWTIVVLYLIAAGICSIFILAMGYRLAQMREQRRRRDRRLGYLRPPFRRG
jgi:uncharacterized membrane protein